MDKNNICPECGAKLKKERYGHSVTYSCPKCGWSVATTESEPIDLDDTEYKIRLAQGTLVCKKTLSVVSSVTGKNFFDSKKVIEGNEVIYAGKARDILKQRNSLTEEGIAFVIEPDFPY